MALDPATKSQPLADRRRHDRHDLELLVHVAEHHTVDRQTRDYLERVADSVSLGGLFVRTSRPHRPGTKLQVELRLSTDGGDAPVVRAHAIVRWRRRWGRDAGMGVEFLDFDSNGRDDLQSFVELVAHRPEVGRRGPRRLR